MKKHIVQSEKGPASAEERVDISTVRIDPDMPFALRLDGYLCQIKNPYKFRCGEIAINICFASEGRPLKEVLTSYLSANRE